MSTRLEFSSHAVSQMQERGITVVQVRWLLDHGRSCAASSRPGREHRLARCGLVGSKEAKVVYIQSTARVLVVTVMWVYEGE